MAVQQQDDHRVVSAVGGILSIASDWFYTATNHAWIEPAIVHIELFNPLQVPISLGQLILGCQYQESTEVQEVTVDAYQVMPEGKQQGDSDMFEFENFDLQKINEITLEPLEKKMVSSELLSILVVLTIAC